MSAALEVTRFLRESFPGSQHCGERVTWLVSHTEARRDPWLSLHAWFRLELFATLPGHTSDSVSVSLGCGREGWWREAETIQT